MPAHITEAEVVYQLFARLLPNHISFLYSAKVSLCFKHWSFLQLCELPHSFIHPFICRAVLVSRERTTFRDYLLHLSLHHPRNSSK